MPGTTPYAQDGALTYALPAAAAVHLHGVVCVIAAVLFRDIIVIGVIIVVVVVVGIIIVVVGLRAQDAVCAFGLRLHFGLQEALTDMITFYNKEIVARSRFSAYVARKKKGFF